METGQYPTVTLLHLSPSASTDHHGSSSRRSVALPADDRPRWFRNPWPSYRVASLNDAWIAYQKGAAIALPHPKVARSSNGLDEQEDDADDNDGLVGREETSLLRTKSRVYVRPEFAAWYEDDHDDDWRDPPTKVVQPSWGEVGEDKETVTWLGHAGVLVQIPWKRKEDGRQGMCGVLFDPIFSYR